MRVFFVIMFHNVFNVWPKTTLVLPVAQRREKVGHPWTASLEMPTNKFRAVFSTCALASSCSVVTFLHLSRIASTITNPHRGLSYSLLSEYYLRHQSIFIPTGTLCNGCTVNTQVSAPATATSELECV